MRKEVTMREYHTGLLFVMGAGSECRPQSTVWGEDTRVFPTRCGPP